jgi:hypothetical protein
MLDGKVALSAGALVAGEALCLMFFNLFFVLGLSGMGGVWFVVV